MLFIGLGLDNRHDSQLPFLPCYLILNDRWQPGCDNDTVFRVLNTVFQQKARNTYCRQKMEILPTGSQFAPSGSLAFQETWLWSPVLVSTTFFSLAVNHCLGNTTSHSPQSSGQPFYVLPLSPFHWPVGYKSPWPCSSQLCFVQSLVQRGKPGFWNRLWAGLFHYAAK